MAQAPKPFRFFDLPLEIRNLVYMYYLGDVSIVANTDKFTFVGERLQYTINYHRWQHMKMTKLTETHTYIVRSLLYSGRRAMVELRNLMLTQTTFDFENCDDLNNLYIEPNSVPPWLSLKSFHTRLSTPNILREIRKARVYLTCDGHRSGDIQCRSTKASMKLLTALHMPSLQALGIKFCYDLYVIKYQSMVLEEWFLDSLTSLSASVVVTLEHSSRDGSNMYNRCVEALQYVLAQHRRVDSAVTYGQSICADIPNFNSYELRQRVQWKMLDRMMDFGGGSYMNLRNGLVEIEEAYTALSDLESSSTKSSSMGSSDTENSDTE